MQQLKVIKIQLLRMKKEQFEGKILLKQNSEMAARLQWYRRQNQELKNKNQELNVWVQNLSQVFAAVSSTWQTITNLEETLYALMKKKTDVKDKTVLSKYIAHFKTFGDIIDNLADKIKNTEHSGQVTFDAKTRLTSFVKNYQIFFKQFVDTYFKFNEQYIAWLAEIQKNPDTPQLIKGISNKELQNRQKIKDFEEIMKQSKDNFKIYQSYNQHMLMDAIIAKKQEQINKLKETNASQSRRLQTIMDFNPQSVAKTLQNIEDANYFQCYCGGAQIKYYKALWEKTLQNLSNQKANSMENIEENVNEEGMNGLKINKEERQLWDNEKNRLIQRNTQLVEKLQTSKLKFRLTQDNVLKSQAYLVLKEQCQYLINYTSDLMVKLRKQAEYLQDIQKDREQQIKQLKRKYQKNNSSFSFNQNFQNQSIYKNKQIQVFKSEVIQAINSLKVAFDHIIEKENKQERILSKTQDNISVLKKQLDQMNKKWTDYHMNQIHKVDKMEFRHREFKQIEDIVSVMLKRQNSKSTVIEQWNQFILYVKSRDKKIKDLESSLRKKQKEVIQKVKVQEIIKEQLAQTQKIYLENKDLTKKVQKELTILIEENFKLKSDYQQQKTMLNLRLKAQTDARNKLQQKLKYFERIEQEIREVKKYEQIIQKNYLDLLNEHRERQNTIQNQSKQKSILILTLQEEINQRQKMLNALCIQKQKRKSQMSEIITKLNSISAKSENQSLIKIMEYYKNKVMCKCTGDRQRKRIIKTCSHLFCQKCIQDLSINRNRKCPICAMKFSTADVGQLIFS